MILSEVTSDQSYLHYILNNIVFFFLRDEEEVDSVNAGSAATRSLGRQTFAWSPLVLMRCFFGSVIGIRQNMRQFSKKKCLLLMKCQHVAIVVVDFYSCATCVKGV